MLRIAGINIPDDKRIEVSLTYIYGVGQSSASRILDELNIPKLKRTKDLSEDEQKKIREYIEKKVRVEGELKHIVRSNIKRLKEIGATAGYATKRDFLREGRGLKPIIGL